MKDYAQPLATVLLAVAIASLPFTLPKAVAQNGYVFGSIDVTHQNSCVDP